MTTQLEPPTPPTDPEPLRVDADTDEELAQLHALYPELKAAADEATKKFDAVKQAIKVKLAERAPECPKFALTSEHGPTLTLTYSTSRRFDSKRFKQDQPAVYETYTYETGSWTLKEA